MDFSKYGYASAQWREFLTTNPGAAQDGFSGNNPSEAIQLQETANQTRATAGAELLAKSGLDSKVDISTTSVPSRYQHHQIPIRRYTSKGRQGNVAERVLVYFHGGGFLFGSEATEDSLCAEIALGVGITVLSVIYSHTPQYVHPMAHDDALDVYDHILKNTSAYGVSLVAGLAVLGISAGASLAAEFVQHDLKLSKTSLSHRPLVAGAVLSIPWLIHIENVPLHLFESPEKASSVQCRDAPVIPWPRLKLFSDLLAAEDITDPRLNAALRPDSELQGWPKTGFVIAGMDPLRDDGLIFAKRLKASG